VLEGYNLQDHNSINKKTKLNILHKFRKNRLVRDSKSHSRFEDKTYFPEKERFLKGNTSVSPDKYNPLPALKASKVRRVYHAMFTSQDRGLDNLKKIDDKDSDNSKSFVDNFSIPNVKSEADIKYSSVPKGAPIGLGKRVLEFKVPTFY